MNPLTANAINNGINIIFWSNSVININVNPFVNQLKETPNINQMQILKTTIIDKIYLTIAIWFFGTTVIGIPIVFGIVAYRGFCLGYTI